MMQTTLFGTEDEGRPRNNRRKGIDLEKRRARDRAGARARYASNPEKVRARILVWRAANPDKVLESRRAYRAANRDKSREVAREWSTKNPAKRLLIGARTRARHGGVECSLTLEWVQERIDAGICEATGMTLVRILGRGRANPYAPSIDRIKAGGPYSPENCRMTTTHFNAAKNLWSDEQVADMARAFLKKFDEARSGG